MSAATTHADRLVPPSLLRQIAVIGSRSVRRTLRQPASIIPPLVFPLMLLAINSAGLADAPKIPNFPADSYLDFALVVTFMQGALFATTTAGIAIGQDIEQGFINRLALTPMRGSALILGQLAGAATIGLLASMVYVIAGLLFGVEFQSGPVGVVVLIALSVGTGIAFASVGAFLALRAGSAEAVQGLFPVMFAALFMSTMSMPLELIESDWFHAVAQANPVTYLIDGMRSLVITGWDGVALGRDVLVLVVFIVFGLNGASRAMRRRLTRT